MEESIKEFLYTNNLSQDNLSYDEKIFNLYTRLPLWLNEIEEEHRVIFLTLLKYFQYFNREKVHNSFSELYEKYKVLEPNYKATIYAPITPKKPIYNGTNEFLHIFREACSKEITSSRIAFQLHDFLKTYIVDTISNFVLIDDIIGTGSTLRDFIVQLVKEFPDKFINRNIYILCLVVHPKGLNKMKTLEKELNIKIICLHSYQLKKAFAKGEIFTEEKKRIEAKRIVREYEKKVAKRNDDVMGFQESEALVGFFHNTPNNTLSTFWEQEAKVNWYPIFPRTIRGEELPLETDSSRLDAIKDRSRKKSNIAQNVYKRIKEAIVRE